MNRHAYDVQCAYDQGCSLGLERLGLEAVSRRFLERLVSSRSREFGKIERLGLFSVLKI